MAFVVVYDACVLFPAPLRDLLMRVALTDLVQAKWTDRILDECFVNLAAYRPELSSERLRRTRELMIQAVRDCMVTGYEPLIDGINLPDPGDRHVLAAAIRANALICLINQANFLLDRQIAALEKSFVEGGGYSEQLATARLAHRRQQDRSDPTDRTDLTDLPKCPQCSSLMALRTAKSGKNAGQQFWGCTKYPDCKGTQPV